MIQIKRLKRPTKLSGRELKPGHESHLLGGAIIVMNVGKESVYVDRVTPKKRKRS